MVRSRPRTLAAAAASGAMLFGFLAPTPASALATENPFTADALPTWQTDGTVWGMASSQGKVVVGGSFAQLRPPGTAAGDPQSQPHANLAVLDAASGAPTSCVLDVTRGTASATVRAVTASPDQSVVYVGGLFSTINGAARTNIAAIDPATCTVLPFNPGASSFVYAIAATTDKVYVGGAFATLAGASRSRAGAVSAATTPGTSTDGALLDWAPVVEDEVLGLGIDPNNGNVVLGGRMDTVNGADSHDLAVVDGVTGTTNQKTYPQPFFPYSVGQGQRAGNSAIKTVATDATGFYIGAEGNGSGIFDGRAAFDWGTYDERWRDKCLGATQALVAYKGVLFNGNHAHDCITEGTFEDGVRHHLNAETTQDKQYLPWWPNTNGGIGEALGPRAITVATSGTSDYLWYGGEFTTVNGVNQQALTRFGQSPDTARPATVSTPNLTSTKTGEVQVMWRATTDNDDKTLTYTLFRGTTAIATATADSEFYYKPQIAYTDIGLTPGTSYTYKVVASDGVNSSVASATRSIVAAGTSNDYANTVVSDGASVYFRMEEPDGSAAASNGSSTLGGTYVNGTTRTAQEGALPTYPGTSASFNGTNHFLRTDQRVTAPTTYSEELWFKTATTAGGRLMGFGNKALANGASTAPNSTQSDRHIYMGPTGKLLFGTFGNGKATTLSSTASYNDNAWHQVVATQGASGTTLYVDGVSVASNTVSTAMIPTIKGYWRIGGDSMSATWPDKPTTGYFAGNIDEAAVYPTVLTGAQIAAHYRLSGRDLDTTPPPAPSVTPATGTYTSAQSVTMSDTEAGAVIRYTVGNGTTVPADPTATDPQYSGPINVASSQVIKAAAFDAAGNVSTITQRSYTINAPTGTTTRTVTLNATADTMARQSLATTTSGTVTGLKSDSEATTGNAATRDTSYVRFTIPALAAGETITAADLSLNVTNATTNGPAIWRTSPTWSETTLNWNSQPARSGTAAVGNYANMTTGRVKTSVTGLTTAGDVSFQLYADASDGLDFTSRETTTQPQLTLTISSDGTTPPQTDTTPPPAPSVTPATGTYTSAQSVTMSDTEAGAVIRYTVGNGTTVPADPTATDPQYSGPINVASSQVIKAAAFDAAGNVSTITQRSYTINAPTGTTTRTVTLNATADTMARQSLATTTSGTVTGLKSDSEATTGNAATRDTSYVRFTIPALAAGETITAADLSLNVTNATTNGPAIWRTSPTWSETTLNWNSQPARSGTAAVGNYANMTTGRVKTSVTGLTTAGDVSFQLYADASDGLDFTSRETTTQPQLTLTITK